MNAENPTNDSGLRLPGMRSDTLLGYLKAIGVLRLVATQSDPFVRASWSDATLILHGISREELIDFFANRYSPTPALNPWNGGAGFDSKSRHQEAGKTLDRIASMRGNRWKPYQNALSVARRVIDGFDNSIEDRKSTILTILRSRYADVALGWLDAAVLFGGDEIKFPPLLGTGGNDGRLDFSINFAQRVLDIAGDVPLKSALPLLRDAIDGTGTTPLEKGSVGQFSLALAGGPNMSNGFSAGSLFNPWDFVFTIEGTMAFAGAVVRRFSATKNRIAAPFTFRSIAAGYAAASAEEPSRGEIWLPCWSGQARYAAIRSLLRSGRVELESVERSANHDSQVFSTSAAFDSIAALQAAQTLGVASGIESFSRIVVAQRNGLAYGATYAGRIAVAERPEIAALSRATRGWVQRARNVELGSAARAALHAYDERTIAYADNPHPRALRDILAALAELDTALAMVRSDVKPLAFLSRDLHDFLVDSQVENDLDNRVARAITSLGASNFEHRIRFAISPIHQEKGNLRYDAVTSPVWRFDVRATLAQIFVRRVRTASQRPDAVAEGYAASFRGGAGLSAADFASMLAGVCDWRYIKELVRAYSIIEPCVVFASANEKADVTATGVPAAFAALKWLVDGVKGGTGKIDHLDAETAVALSVGHDKRAFDSAYARLRSSGVDVRDFRYTRTDPGTVHTFVAALCVPATSAAIAQFKRYAVLDRSRS